MKFSVKILIVIFTLSLFSWCKIYSQKIGSPIEPGTAPIQREIGIVLGLGYNFQSGILYPTCTECQFDNGHKFGFSIGAVYEQEINRHFRFGIMGMFDNMNLYASYLERESVWLYSKKTDLTFLAEVLFRHEANSQINYLSGIPFLKWSPTQALFFKLGFSVSYLSSAKIQHKKILLDRIIRVENIDTLEVELAQGGYEKILDDGDIAQTKSLQFFVVPMVGLNFYLGGHFYLSPEFIYMMPLMAMSDKSKDFKINAWRIALELRYAFTVSKYQSVE
jgi:hypothetical protein